MRSSNIGSSVQRTSGTMIYCVMYACSICSYIYELNCLAVDFAAREGGFSSEGVDKEFWIDAVRGKGSSLECDSPSCTNGAFFDLTRTHFCVPATIEPTAQLATLT